MDIIFLDDRLKKTVNNDKRFRRKFRGPRGELLKQRLDELSAAQTLQDMRSVGGHCHELRHERSGQLAINLDGPYRLVFEPAHDPPPLASGGNLKWELVTAVRIIEVTNHYG